MGKNRLEAFSDGVLAIIITITVLGLRPPHGTGVAALRPVLPVFLSYVLSFVYLGIYWNNHHHMLATVDRVSGGILWANLHLLFWLSLVPFVTGWMGATRFAATPTAVYGVDLLMAAIAYFVLQRLIIASQGQRLAAGQGHRPRPQGQGVADHLRRGHRRGVPGAVAGRRPLRARGDHLADPRPADRARLCDP